MFLYYHMELHVSLYVQHTYVCITVLKINVINIPLHS